MERRGRCRPGAASFLVLTVRCRIAERYLHGEAAGDSAGYYTPPPINLHSHLVPVVDGERVRALMRVGSVDLLAGDNHGDERSLGDTYCHLVAARQSAAAAQLCSSAAQALLNGTARPSPISVE